MAGKKLEYEVKVDASDATSELKKVGEAGEKAGKQLVDGFKDAGSKSEAAFDKVIAGLKDVTTESKRTIETVDKIGAKFGEGFDPQATAQLVNSLRKAGVEFDTIEARADELATTMRELQDVRIDAGGGLKRVGDDAHAAGGHVGELSDSARGANSALANMVGNSAQDLGALGGIAGSAGVAIGQMAEYASDAALGGEALGASLKSMATVAGPIAALSAAMLALQGIMKLIHRDDGLTAAQVAAVSEALADQIGVLDEYQAAVSSAFGQGTADTIEVFTEAILKSIEATKGDEFITNLETSLGRLGVVRQQFGEIAAESQQEQAAFFQSLLNLHGVVGPLQADLADYYTGLGFGTDATAEWARQNPELAASFLAVSDALGEARKNNNAATQDFLDNQASINDGTKALVNAATATAAAQAEATGSQFNWNDALKAYIELQQQVLQIGGAIAAAGEAQADATAASQQAMEDQTDAVADGIQAWKDYAASVQEATIDVGKIIDEIPDIAGALDTEFGKVNDAFDGLSFDINFQSALDDALEQLEGFEPDIQTVVDHYGDILSGQDIEILGNVRADDPEAIARIQALQQLVQKGTINAFRQGGVDAANTFVQSTAATIAASKGISIEEAYRLMGVPEGQIALLIEPEVDAQHADQARAILDSLAGVEGGEAREARIHVALETGQIDGDVAYIASLLLAHEALGINVEPQLAGFTPAQIAQAQAIINGSGVAVTVPVDPEASDSWFNSLWAPKLPPVVQPVTLEAPNAGAVGDLITAVADTKRTANIDVKADNAGRIDGILDDVADPRTASITAEAHPAGANAALNGVALPRTASITAEAHVGVADTALDGVAHSRSAPVTAVAHTAAADRDLDRLTADRFADIFVVTHNSVVGGGSSGGGGTAGGNAVIPDAVTGFADAEAVGINPLVAADASTVYSLATPVSVATPTVSPVVHNHVTIQAAVIGSRFDVQRAVTKALRQAQRINGGRAA